jgi:ABC-2 type transport system permease protein
MRLFWELSRLSFQRQLTYRAATWAGIITNAFFGLLRALILIALYGSRQEVAGLTLVDAITFTALSQAVIGYLAIFGWYDLMNSVYTGEISSNLLKPVNFFRFWLALDLGRAVGALLLRGVTMLLLYALFVRITVPQEATQWAALAVTIVLSWFVSFCWRFIVNVAAFWSPNARGVGRFAFGIVWAFSGFQMPLRYFPDWFAAICHATPFPSMVNTVVEVYLGLLTGPQLLFALSYQLFWGIVLALIGLWLYRSGVRRLVIQGG